MTSDLGALAVAASGSAALSLLFKTTLALVAGLIAARVTRHARASVRHIILASTFVAILALPLAATLLPPVSFDVPVAQPASQPAPPAAAAPRSAPAAAPTASTNARAETPLAAAMATGTIVAAAWAAGALLFSLSFAVAIWRLRALRRHALPWLEARALVDRLAAQAGIRKPVDILLHEEVTAPLTCGLGRPAIILPADAPEWSEASLRRALVHELEHVRRRDWSTHLTARALCAGYWFQPLVWIAYRQLSLEAERACDDAVVEREEGTQYAEQLVSLARRMAASAGTQPALAMASRSDLARRVTAVLDSSQSRGRAGLLRAAVVATAAAALVLTLAPVKAVGAAGSILRGDTVDGGEQRRNRPSSRMDRALVEAAAEGDLVDVRELVNDGANVNASVLGDGSPLIGAVRSGNLQMVTFLLDRGADPNLGVAGDGSPLISAAQSGSVQLVTYLLDRGADPNVGVEGDGSPLIAAAREGSVAMVELLLARGAKIEQVVAGDENPLIQACESGRLGVVQLLVARGANVNARVWADGYNTTGEWRTPLSMARRRGNPDVVAFLVSKGAVE